MILRVPAAETGPQHWLGSTVPEGLRGTSVLGVEVWQWFGVLAALLAALALGRFAAWALARVGGMIAARTTVQWDNDLVQATRGPARFFFALASFHALVGMLDLPAGASVVVAHVVGTLAAAAIAWLVARSAGVVGDAIERRARASAGDDADSDAERRARGVATQVRVMRRVINFTVGIIAVALMLTQFEVVRSVGLSLLASAGIAGVVLGLAAQKTLAGIFAGIQLTATQPIRIGDVVIVEGEWGTIDEITLTFVVVKIWDERRLVVPITRFLDQPFQNWTMQSAQLLGTIFFYVDWTFPVDTMRAELEKIVKARPEWDGRVQNVQVTDAKERTLEVRALVSAADASKLWDLRVQVREKIVTWLQGLEGGKYLPRLRLEEDSRAAVEPRPSRSSP